MRDAMRGYLNAATGLTELTRKRAQDLAQSLLGAAPGSGGGAAVAHQVSSLAEELVAAAKSNRHAVQEMIRAEVEMAVGRLGLVPASELAAARRQIAELESAVAELRRRGSSGAHSGSAPAAAARTTRRRPPRAAVKRAVDAQSAAATSATKTAATKTAATKTAATKKAAAKSATKKAAAKSATKKAASKSATRKAAPRSGTKKAAAQPAEPTS